MRADVSLNGPYQKQSSHVPSDCARIAAVQPNSMAATIHAPTLRGPIRGTNRVPGVFWEEKENSAICTPQKRPET